MADLRIHPLLVVVAAPAVSIHSRFDRGEHLPAESYRRAVSVMKSNQLRQCRISVRDVLLPRMLLIILRLIRSPDLAIYELMKDLP